MSTAKSRILLLIVILSFTLNITLSAQEQDSVADFLFDLGEAYFKENRLAEAKHELKKCLVINPEHKRAKELLQRIEEESVTSTKDELKKKEVIKSTLEGIEKKIPKEQTFKKQLPALPSQRVDWTLKQGTWHLKQGDFYGEIYTKYYWHTQEFDNEGHKKRWAYGGGYYEVRTEYKLEYGLTDRTTLLLNPVFKRVNWEDDYQNRTRTGFVEIWPGIKHLLFDKPFFCWLQGRIKLPLNYREGEGVVAALGTHQIDGEIKLLTAQAWPKLPGYTKFELGFKGRNEEPPNEIIYSSQLGYNLSGNLILEITLDGQEGLAQTGGVDEDWIKYTVGPVFKVGFLNIKFGYGNTFAGKNTSAAQEVYLSIYTWW